MSKHHRDHPEYGSMGAFAGYGEYEEERGARVLTPTDWRLGRGPTGRSSLYRFVDPDRENRTKEDWPYSYSDHYLWGEHTKDSSAVYSDRLAQWDGDKAKAAREEVADLNCRYGYWGKEGTSKYLSAYFGKPVEAVAVAEGCNVSSGYPYWIFWFRDASTALTSKDGQ